MFFQDLLFFDILIFRNRTAGCPGGGGRGGGLEGFWETMKLLEKKRSLDEIMVLAQCFHCSTSRFAVDREFEYISFLGGLLSGGLFGPPGKLFGLFGDSWEAPGTLWGRSENLMNFYENASFNF